MTFREQIIQAAQTVWWKWQKSPNNPIDRAETIALAAACEALRQAKAQIEKRAMNEYDAIECVDTLLSELEGPQP